MIRGCSSEFRVYAARIGRSGHSKQPDREIAERIRRALLQHEFGVWFDEAVTAGQDWAAAIHSAIDEAVTRGFVLVLLSPASLASRWCKRETEHALELAARSQRSNAIPVVVAPFAREALPEAFANIQWFDLTTGVFEQRVNSSEV